MTQATQDPIASAIDKPQPTQAFGIVKRSPKAEIRRIGLTQDGQWYLYGDSASGAKDNTVEALATPRIYEMNVVTRAKQSKYGPRDYLDVVMAGETPQIRYALSLPISFHDPKSGQQRVTWPVRSLLSALSQLDLSQTPLKLEPSRGTDANFTNVFLDPEGNQRVNGGDIGSDMESFRRALNKCRQSLGQPPLNEMASAADDQNALPSND